jgi:alkyl hydroperoxide reductase subunit AhpC
MAITVGGSVPRIQVPAYVRGRRNARLIGPGDEPGRWVVLAFYPRDFVSECAAELAALAELERAYADENAVVMAVSTASWLSHRRWFEHHPEFSAVHYPILADTACELARAFGTLEDDGTCRRVTFLIDPEGVVRHATVARGRTRRSAFETLAVLRALRSEPVLLAA